MKATLATQPVSTDELVEALHRQEAGASEVLAKLYRSSLKYDHSERAWYLWRGHFWQRDGKGEVVQLVVRELSARFYKLTATLTKRGGKDDRADAETSAKLAANLCRQQTVDSVLRLARTHPAIALDGSEWDANPWLLGTQNGVVDLRTGNLLPEADAKAALIRSVATVDWQGLDAPAPQWEAFIAAILGNDADLIETVWRLLGYGITGLPKDRVFPILYGTGANGKTTLIGILQTVLGKELSDQADARALMQSARSDAESARPFLRDLQGKRLVMSVEAKADAELDPALVKWATGGDKIAARRLHENKVTFSPSHLLLFGTNYKPKAPANDLALWDRVMLIPFNQRFVVNPDPQQADEHPKDATIKDRLPREEGPGILAWLVRGCLAWQRDGLKMADAITAASNQYRADAKTDDEIGSWIADCCVEGNGYQAQSTLLYQSWELWAKTNGVKDTHSVIWLGKRMVERGYQRDGKTGVIMYQGLGLKTP
jgi:putative DNA primase/helicase